MGKRRRTTAQRNAAKRKWKLAQESNGGDQSTGATDATDSPTSPQAAGESHILKSESAFKPETLTESTSTVIGQGLGDSIKSLRQWDEIRAVKERYPVSQGILQRIAFESIAVVTSTTTATRDKLIAAKLLFAMAQGNQQDKGLPSQIEGISIDARSRRRQIIDAVLADEKLGILDCREYKVEPGSIDDYAE